MQTELTELTELLLNENKALEEALRLTDSMATAEAEELPALVRQRGWFLEGAHEMHKKARAMCTPRLLSVLEHTAKPASLTEQEQQVFDLALTGRAAVNRLRENSEPARLRLSDELETARQKLEELDSGSARAMKGYARVMRGVRAGTDLPEKHLV